MKIDGKDTMMIGGISNLKEHKNSAFHGILVTMNEIALHDTAKGRNATVACFIMIILMLQKPFIHKLLYRKRAQFPMTKDGMSVEYTFKIIKQKI